MATRDEYLTEMHFPNLTIKFPTADEQVATQRREICRMLNVDEKVVSAKIALNAAQKSDGYLSLMVSADGSLNPKIDSLTKIPEGIAKKGKTLTQDAVSDVLTLIQIADALQIDPVLFAKRLSEDAAKREIY
jgi:hypothetical protein